MGFLNEKSYFDPEEESVQESAPFLGVSELGFTFPSPSRHAQWEPGAKTVFIHCPWNKGGLKNCHLLLSLSVMNTLFREGWNFSQVLPGALWGWADLPGLTVSPLLQRQEGAGLLIRAAPSLVLPLFPIFFLNYKDLYQSH